MASPNSNASNATADQGVVDSSADSIGKDIHVLHEFDVTNPY